MKVVRIGVFETNSSSVHTVTFSNVGLQDSQLPMKDGYVIAHYGEFGRDRQTFNSQEDKLSYLVTCCYYLNGFSDYDIETSYNFRQIEDVLCNYIPGCQGIKIAENSPEPEIDHQSIPEFDIEIVNIWDEDALINFIFNENILLKTDCD